MKKYLLALSIMLCSYFGFAQNGFVVQSNEKGLYVSHTVSPKENFYSIGRLYAISPKDIAAFNSLDMTKGLSIGQTIMVPLNATNFSQSEQKGTPVYYVVGDKEGLYRVSQRNNNVTMANLRKWNNLSSDNISTGQKIIVGYVAATGAPANTTVAKAEPPVTKTEAKEQTQTTTQAPPVQKKPEPVVEKKRDEPKVAASTVSNTKQVASGGAGYFKNQFESQNKKAADKDVTATAGIFKTASGWQDAKYYALIDNVEPGTIIRVVNPSNNKAIYAKVLGEMTGIRQNQGLDVRISNAAASALDISEDDKFIVKVNY